LAIAARDGSGPEAGAVFTPAFRARAIAIVAISEYVVLEDSGGC
jgi:hypothetical protein